MKKQIATLLFISLFCCSCAESKETKKTEGISDKQADALVQRIADKQILVAIHAFSDEVIQLGTNADEFCSSFEEAHLTKTQASWRRMAQAWYRVQLFNFGPADADPIFPLFTFIDSLRLRGTDYRETVSSRLEEWGSSEESIDNGFFTNERFQNVGLLAIELALFDDKLSTLPQERKRRCEILIGLNAQLERRSVELTTGWTKAYADTNMPFVELLKTRQLPNGRAPFTQILISAQEYLDYLHNRSVVTLAGQISETNWLLLTEALTAIETLLEEDHGKESVLDIMEQLDSNSAVTTVRRDLEAARLALESKHISSLRTALTALDGDFKREIPEALGVELGINWTDGD